MIKNGHADVKNSNLLGLFSWYHSTPDCISYFYPDIEIDFKAGIIVIISPGNNVQKIEDHMGKGMGSSALTKFIEKLAAPAFDRLTSRNMKNYFSQNTNPENK